jgi:hypothetical protein
MSKIDEILEDATPKKAYYEEEFVEEIQPGTYKAKIIGMRNKLSTIVKGGSECDIYWPRYQIDKEHPQYGGMHIRDSGLFRYKESEPHRNLYYKKFLDKIGIELKKVKENGKIIYELPPLLDEMIFGKEVMITVHEESWMSNKGRKKAIVATLTKILH